MVHGFLKASFVQASGLQGFGVQGLDLSLSLSVEPPRGNTEGQHAGFGAQGLGFQIGDFGIGCWGSGPFDWAQSVASVV